MNIKDIELELESLPWRTTNLTNMDGQGSLRWGDLLCTLFEGQKDLMDKYHGIEKKNGTLVLESYDYGDLDAREVQTRLKDLCWRMVEELGEAMNCLKNRPHKTTFQATDVEHFYEELADAFHYMLEIFITAGLKPEDLFSLYFRKHAVNLFRQDTNY